MMPDTKLMVLAGLLVAALFVFAVVLGDTQGDDVTVPADVGGGWQTLESVLHRVPGLGPGRNLEPADLADSDCPSDNSEVTWTGPCDIRVPDDVGAVEFIWDDGAGTVELTQEGVVDQRAELPGDFDESSDPNDPIRLPLSGDGGHLTLNCAFNAICTVLLVGADD